jgi:predicted permease
VLGLTPLLGRLISPEDDVHGAGNPVAVLSHAYWQSRLAGQREVLNQPLRVNGQVFTIVGVAPRGFTGTTFGDQPDVFVPLAFKPQITPGWDGRDKWNHYWLYAFARVAPGSTRQQAADALNSSYRGLVEEQSRADETRFAKDPRFRASRLTLLEGDKGQSEARNEISVALFVLMASTVLVLLIAIANTANLLLARGAQRVRELAIRTALGAGRGAIVRQVLAESMVLSAGGGIAGLLIASWSLQLLLVALGNERPQEDLTTDLSATVLGFAVGSSLLAGLLCGLYPAWAAARRTVSDMLRDQSSNASASLGSARVRKLLVCGQVTLSALLLVVTGLFLKSLVNLLHVDLGIRTDSVITFGISPELNGYTPERSRALFERVEESLRAIPGVQSVSASMVPLISGSNYGNSLTVEGYSRDDRADRHSMFNAVSAGYFANFGVPLVAGREITERDTLAGPKVAVVNQTFAKHFFGHGNPIGRKFTPGSGKEIKPDIEIVGVVKDLHYAGVKQTPPRLYYLPWRQNAEIGSIAWYVRTALPPQSIVPQLRRVMSSLDRDLPLENVRTLDDQIRNNIRSDRVTVQLSAAFAILATVLAMLGLYGVMAYSVTARTREIGIRLALGAPGRRVRAMVFSELALILIGGLAIGIPGAIALARVAETRLFGVRSFDPTVVAAATAALLAASMLAGYFPARRAARIEPGRALRQD